MQTLSQRKAYGDTLVQLGKENEAIVALDADLGKSTMSIFFQQEFPQRFFEMGIAEANMISTAAGLSLAGKIPFASTFAVFATGRPYDQIRTSVCIPNLNVKICGSSAGLSDFGDGSTHQSIDDIALMRVLPNMHVFSPVDAAETERIMRAMLEIDGPCYMRVNRNDLPNLTGDQAGPYEPGKLQRMNEPGQLTLVATGVMVSVGLQAAKILAAEGIKLEVHNLSTIKPIDTESLAQALEHSQGLITAEEHSVVGGMGSAVLEAMAGNLKVPVHMIGIQDQFGTSAHGYEELLEAYGLTAEAIVKAAREMAKA